VTARRLATAWERLRRTIRHEASDPEFQAEMEEHVRLLAERYHRQGMSEEPATLAARRQFGNATLLREDRRALQTMPFIEAFENDLMFGVRMLRKNPAFALAAVVTLALGIGANTAIFSVCNAVLFKPLPYADPDRLVMLWERDGGGALTPVAPANFVDWRSASRSFSNMAALNPGFGGGVSFVLDRQSEAARLAGARVSSNFFSLLGVRLALGRSSGRRPTRTGPRRDSQPPRVAGALRRGPEHRGEPRHAGRYQLHRGRRAPGGVPLCHERCGF
jgi:putative ABC transport system permease protein